MFTLFSKKLTEMSHHYVDWSRVGSLIRSKKHHYSADEIFKRSALISFTAAAAFVGYYFNDIKNSNYSNTSASIMCAIAGFVLSHSVLIFPLIKKRCEISKEFVRVSNEIMAKLSLIDNPSLAVFIMEVMQRITTLSLSNNEQARASQTWGKRLALLTLVNDSFSLPSDKFIRYWENQNVDSMMTILLTSPANPPKSLRI